MRILCQAPLFCLVALVGLASHCFATDTSPNPYLTSLIQAAHAKHLSEARPWRLLLHDHFDLTGRYQSDIDDPMFFLDEKGRRDPSAELDATLEAFFQPASPDIWRAPSRDGKEEVSIDTETQHPQCRYPARYAWLKEQLHFDSRLPEQPCLRFEKWRTQMDPGSVSLIFASYYLNNPASMYGHTFLRFNGKHHTDQERLLDYTVNFAAFTNTTNGVLFAVKGLMGGYRGQFSSMPYYLKVQEYNNLESRDLWEYSLNLSSAAIDRMERHLWELGPTSMAYYFLNKNCSYQLLPLLEVSEPTLHLVDPFWFKAIPVDTLRRVIQQRGLLAGIQVRPSHVSKMLATRAKLTSSEVEVAEKLANKTDDSSLQLLKQYPQERQALVLDSAFDLFRYRVGFHRDQPDAVQSQERQLLLARSKLNWSEAASPTPFSGPPSPNGRGMGGEAIPPDQGHPTGRGGVSYGFSNHSHFEEVSARAALHDQEDDTRGYVPGSQLEMFNLRLRYDNDRKTLYVQDFTLVDIMSLSPWDNWVRKPSWNLHTGLAVANDLNRDPENSLYYGLNGGSGLSYQSHLWRHELYYVLAEVDGGVGNVFEDSYRLGGGMNSGVMVEATSWWKIHFTASYINYPVGNTGDVVKLQLIQAIPLGRMMQFRATLERQNVYKEVLFSLLRYF